MPEPAQPTQRPREVIRLVSANVPADQGLSALGLIMQLAGGVTAAVACFFGFAALIVSGSSSGNGTVLILLLTLLSLVRSLMHRAAGAWLLYEPAPLRGIDRYVMVSVAHAVVMTCVLGSREIMPWRTAVAVGLGLEVWPALLAFMLRQPRFRRFEDELPAAEDKGFEGASVLMAIFGAAGLGLGLLAVKGVFSTPGSMSGLGALVLLTFVMLVVRSIAHLSAGISGLRDVPLDTAVERVGRYANLGIVSAYVAAGVLLLYKMSGRADFAGMLLIAVVGWLLALWPITLRRFFSERQFASLLAGDAAPIHRRAPDAGLTALGWLLFGLGGLGSSLAVIGLIGGSTGLMGGLFSQMMSATAWGILLSGLQLFAGYQLICMSPNHRIIATVTALITALFQVLSMWPLWTAVTSVDSLMDVDRLSVLAMLLFPLLLSVAVILLVNRNLTPMAQAVVRRGGADHARTQ
jgi:hypothetical protein